MLAHIDDLPLKEKIVEKKKCIHQAIIFAVVHFDRKASDEKGVWTVDKNHSTWKEGIK